MFNPHWTPQTRMTAFSSLVLGAALAFASSSACAQSDFQHNGSTVSTNESSSSNLAVDSSSSSSSFSSSTDSALPAAPSASGAASAAAAGGQSDRSSPGFAHRLAFEAGGGFNAPAGGDQKNYITWGGQFTVGGGYRFTDRLTGMIEYQFIDDKLPGALIAETGANGGNAHIWSITVAPVFDLFPKRNNDVYVTGGGGFYRKVTNFTDPEETEYCDFYYCEPGVVNEVVGHFSSNQGGWNIGGGFTHRMGGIYGDGKVKLFAEVRYLDVLTPAVNHLEPNGLSATSVAADTKLIPITLGVRF